MSDGKMNYERQRARREMRGEIYDEIRDQYGDPQETVEDRKLAHLCLYFGACILRTGTGSKDDPTIDAVQLYQAAKYDAEQLYPSPPERTQEQSQ